MTTLDAVLDGLAESLDQLAADTCARIYAELDAYATITPESLASAVGRNLRTALTALRDGRVPHPTRLDGAAQTARERYDSGVPVEEIVRGFRISISLIHERFVDLAVSLGLPVDTIVTGSRIMWGVGDAFTTRIITEYHALEVDAALRDAQHRAALVRALLAGEVPHDAGLVAITPQGSYAAVRCDVPAGRDTEPLRARLEATGSLPATPALVVLDGTTCLGVVATRPVDLDVPVGLGPFVRPGELPRSDHIARQALRLAQRLGRRGVASIDELGWRMAAASRPDVWQWYADRFLTPVLAQGPFGDEVLAAVRAWLASGQSILGAAQALTVHVNTVRYRLRRFEDLTNADLTDPDDVLGVTWAVDLGDPTTFAL